jgi:hypothetical protein
MSLDIDPMGLLVNPADGTPFHSAELPNPFGSE